MNRRGFFAFLPLAPLALITEGVRAATADGAPIPEATQLVITGTKKYKPVNTTHGIYFNMDQNDPNKQVSMAVGDDGDLWLKRKDGNWRKVVTE